MFLLSENEETVGMRLLPTCLVGVGVLFVGVRSTAGAASANLVFDAEGEAACCEAVVADEAGERFYPSGVQGEGRAVIRPKAW